MAYDEGLAQRIRELLEDDPRISEKRMFGGVAFMANGNMAAGVIRDELMVRVGPDAHDAAVALPHARMMDFTGRPMRGFIQVAPAGFEDDAELRAWLERGITYAASQQKKPQTARAEPARKARKVGAAKPRPPRATKTKRARKSPSKK